MVKLTSVCQDLPSGTNTYPKEIFTTDVGCVKMAVLAKMSRDLICPIEMLNKEAKIFF